VTVVEVEAARAKDPGGEVELAPPVADDVAPEEAAPPRVHLGRDLLVRFAEQVGENGTVERQPLLEGKQMSLVITSNHKPKPRAADGGTEEPAGVEQPQVAAAPPPA